ncbi:hypothetical protein OCO53_25300 [Peribacillus frigoritolerans]|uniref:hypothetical protein n=1 Tax=Peribacillus frigoritolerans TaxID=450367 RepID=UPI0021CE46B6|nr:hypothetical protein [Peribacillus frigoritolerans]MCU6603760.1 hypothetical protein [Peribacillus frigoritolerans]
MEHTLEWVVRKYKQARKDEFEKSNARVMEGFKSILLVLDSALNQGKDMENILPSYEQAMKLQQSDDKDKPSIFIEKQWWIQSSQSN